MNKEEFIMDKISPKHAISWARICDPNFDEIMRANPEKRVMLLIFESINSIMRYMLDLTVEEDKKVMVIYSSKTSPLVGQLIDKFPSVKETHNRNPDAGYIVIGCGTLGEKFQFFSCVGIDI